MHVHVRGNLVALWLACLAGPGSVAWADYVPVPIVEVGKPRLNDIAYSPDGGTLATLTGEWVELLDTDTFETVARFGQGGGRIEFSPDGSEIAVLRYHDSGSIYDVSTGTSKETLPATHRAYAFSPNWRRLAFSTDDIVHVWDRDTQAVTATLEGDPEPALLVVRSGSASTSTTRQRVNHLAFHPDGVRLLVASYRATVAAWDSFSGELIRHYSVGETWVQGMSIRPDGTDFAVHGATANAGVGVWGCEAEKSARAKGR